MAIPQIFDEAFERIKQLVSIFSDSESKYLAPGYSEAQARLDFRSQTSTGSSIRLLTTNSSSPRASIITSNQMLEARKQLAAARSEGDKNFYESKCATLDRQIDNLVYELYDLTPEEIAIVEGAST